MEVAALGLKVEGVEGIDRAAASLDGLAAAGVKAEKSTQGVGRGSAGAKPSVDALAASADKAAQAEARLAAQAEKAGISVGQMKASLRGVPAQFTDIAVSLQGGMSPLTVFLQQGGQLKDMFNGAGNAARALGGYVAGLVNPFTVAAAGAAALGVAYYQGSKEQDAFMVSMAKTGNSAGVTTSSLRTYSQQISDTVGTQGKAAESLDIFIASGVKAGGQLSRLTQTAIAWEKATGEGVDKVAEKYVALQNDPLKAAMKLNEGMNFLTLSVYEQISSLEDQGKTTEAAKVAMDALDQAMADRSKTIEANLGSIQRAWNGITGAAKGAWDAMLNIGRPASLDEQIADVEKQLDRLTSQQGFGETGGGAATGRVTTDQQNKVKESIRLLQEQKFALMDKADAERIGAVATEQNAKAVAAKSAWDKIVNATLSKSEKLELALAKVRETAAAAGITGVELEKQLNAERKKYAETTKKATGEFKTFLTSIEAKIAANEAELFAAGKLTESAKLQIELDAKVKTGKFKLSEAQKELAKDSIKRLADQEKEQKAIQRAIALNDERVASQEEMNKAMNDLDSQVTKVRLSTFEYSESLADQIEMTDLETQTIGMNSAARQVMIDKLRIEQDLRKRRQAINDAPFKTDEERDAEIAKIDEAGIKAKTLAERKIYVSEWEKTSQMIGDTLSDYIMGGGKDAATYLKRLFANLILQPVVQYGVNYAMGALGGGQQGSALGSVLGGNNVGTTVLNNAGLIGAGYQAAFGASVGASSASLIGANAVGAVGGDALGALIATNGAWAGVSTGAAVGSTAVGGAGAAAGAGSLMTGIMAAAPYLAAIVALYAIISGMDDSGTPHFGAGSVYSKATGVQEGSDIYNQGTFGMGHRDEYSAEMQAGISGIAQGLGQTLDAFAVSFGKTAGYSVATAFADDSSDDGSWGSLKIMDQLGNKLVDWADSRESKWAPREFSDGKEGYEEYLKAVAVDVKSAFLAMDLPEWSDSLLKAATDIDSLNTALQQIATVKSVFDGLGKTMSIFADLTGDAQTRLLEASGSIDALASNASSFYEGFYSEGERAQKQRELQMESLSGMGLYIDPYQGDAAKESFRKTVEEAMASGQAEMAAQLLAMSGAFAATAEYGQTLFDESAKAAEDAIEKAKVAAAESVALAASWTGLGQVMAMFSGITVEMQAGLLSAAGSMDALTSGAQEFIQNFYSDDERMLRQRETQMSALAGMGLYIDPAEGDKAKELFRKTVEEAMSSGQAELAVKLQAMSGAFAESADYAAGLAKSVADERYSLESSYLSVIGDTAQLRARELSALSTSNQELQKLIWARQDEAEASAKAAQKIADTQKAIDSVTSGFSGLRETITLDQLGTDESKYGYFKAQADSLTRMLPQLQDQEAIARAVNEIQSLTSRAYGSLDESQKIEMGDEFLQYLAKTEDLALKNIDRTNKDQADATGKAVGDAVAKEVGRIVDAITRLASDSGELSRETVEAIRRLSTQTGNTVVGTGQKYAEVNA